VKDQTGPINLTETLRTVLELVKTGRTNKEIARIRGVSEQAVKRQVSILMRRFDAETRTELVHLVYELELRNTTPVSEDNARSGACH
jgi:DNA-binding NarL/FixJ family response regulator